MASLPMSCIRPARASTLSSYALIDIWRPMCTHSLATRRLWALASRSLTLRPSATTASNHPLICCCTGGCTGNGTLPDCYRLRLRLYQRPVPQRSEAQSGSQPPLATLCSRRLRGLTYFRFEPEPERGGRPGLRRRSIPMGRPAVGADPPRSARADSVDTTHATCERGLFRGTGPSLDLHSRALHQP